MHLGKVTPILRIFDEAKALEFYVDFLGFKVDWQHRFEANFPLYLQVSLGECVLHLSEHHGVHRTTRLAQCEDMAQARRRWIPGWQQTTC